MDILDAICVGAVVAVGLNEDSEEQEDLWRKESRNPRQLSVRLILDGLKYASLANTVLDGAAR